MPSMVCANSYISIATANSVNTAKQSICINVPRKAGKLINC